MNAAEEWAAAVEAIREKAREIEERHRAMMMLQAHANELRDELGKTVGRNVPERIVILSGSRTVLIRYREDGEPSLTLFDSEGRKLL